MAFTASGVCFRARARSSTISGGNLGRPPGLPPQQPARSLHVKRTLTWHFRRLPIVPRRRPSTLAGTDRRRLFLQSAPARHPPARIPRLEFVHRTVPNQSSRRPRPARAATSRCGRGAQLESGAEPSAVEAADVQHDRIAHSHELADGFAPSAVEAEHLVDGNRPSRSAPLSRRSAS